MKKLLLLSAAFLFLTINTQGQDQKSSKQTEYCILQIYGAGYFPKDRGAYIAYEDLKVEKHALIGTDHE